MFTKFFNSDLWPHSGDMVAVASDGHYYILIPMEFHQVRPHSINNGNSSSSSPFTPLLHSFVSHLNYCHGALWLVYGSTTTLPMTTAADDDDGPLLLQDCGKTNKNIVVVGTSPNDNVSVRISLVADGIARQLN